LSPTDGGKPAATMATRSTPTPEPQDHPGSRLDVEQKAGDSVVIAGDIEIVLLQVKGDRAHIGVIAPEGVAIARGEVYRERSRDYLT
jgi:carbon storage regulator CsrA